MERYDKIMVVILVLFVIGFVWSYVYIRLNQIDIKKHCDSTQDMCNIVHENLSNDEVMYAQALSSCGKDILLIDIRDRSYIEALESFNHEYAHCKYGKIHYKIC